MSFTKLFSSIITSTIWMEDSETKIVWITMLALADKNGEVQGSIPGLARLAGVPVEACRAALEKFLNPDPDSRTKEEEGRRIEEIDGGWLLLNYAKYRKMASKEEQIAKATERTRRYRARRSRNGLSTVGNGSSTKGNGASMPVHDILTEAEAEAEAEAVIEQKSVFVGAEPAPVPAKRKTKLPEGWKPTPEQLAYAQAQGCQDPADTAERFRLHHLSKGTLGADWNLGFQYWCRNEKNFRRGEVKPKVKEPMQI